MFSLTKGAHILRVHDVKEAVQTVKLYNKIKNANE
jgi:dihydropteroate synthase